MMDILSFERGSYHRGPDPISEKRALRLCLRDGRHKGDMQDLAQEPLVHVYVPTSPNPTSGIFFSFPSAR
jgi:uncharacterized membrane protein